MGGHKGGLEAGVLVFSHDDERRRTAVLSQGCSRPSVLLGLLLLALATLASPAVVPSFSLKSIQQSTPMSGATNTLTVSLTAEFDLAAGSTVTITGLTGSQTADSASLTVTSTDGRLGTSGAWTQSSGQLVLTAASGGTVSGTACEVTFALTNPATGQVSPAVSVSAEIQDGSGNSVGSIASAAMDTPGTALYGVANGADPLTVVVPSFSLKSIQQSTPASGATNTLTVSLTADFDLAMGSTVTITGLTGSQTADSASLTVTSTGGRLGTSGAWTQSSGQLVLTAASGGTASGTACEVTFSLTNPATGQASPAVSVSAEIKDESGNSVGSIASAAMTKPGTALYGVANGADPLTVVVPSFSLKSIQQSTPASGATNTLTVSLTADFDLATGSTVTITGLTGSQTADSASLTVTSTDGRLGTSGAWSQSSGQLVLTAASVGTVSGTACEVTFSLTNPDSAQASPAVSVSAEIQDESGNSVGSIASAAMDTPGTALYGVANGADPLTVEEVPSFSLKSIQQSTPASGATNTLTVSLTADFDLAMGSTVTITGLTGSQTADSASLTVTSTGGRLGTSGAWTQSSGQLGC
jgi:trimeric autotransporter adhesin